MANNLENESFVPTGLEIVLYNDQEAPNRRECPNNVITAEPLTWWKPNEESGAVEEDGSTRKRKRAVSEVEVENDKEFSLMELYKSNNIHEMLLKRQKDESDLDPQELQKLLKGWTVEKRKRTEKNGRDRVDKTYRHPKCKRVLRSLLEVKKFLEENSQTGKTSDNGRVSHEAQTDFFLQISKRFEKNYGDGAQPTFNNSSNRGSSSSWSEQLEAINEPKTAWRTTFNSHDTVDLSRHLHRPFNYHERMIQNSNVVPIPQPVQISHSSTQAFTNLMMSNGQECVRTFGVGPPPYDVFGDSSSLTNTPSLDEIKMMVQTQVEAQVAEKVSQYEKTQREMAEQMQSMQRLLALEGMFPPPQFPNPRRS